MEVWKEFDQNEISHSAAHHLMAVDKLVQRLGYARVSDVARELSITRGSVSISLKPMREAGLIEQDENKHLRLSARGQALADAIKVKRRVVQRLLGEFLGVEARQAEIDACKFEHLMSNESARRMVAFLRFLDSRAERAAAFERAWRDSESSCDHAPEHCPSCEESCMVRSLPLTPLAP